MAGQGGQGLVSLAGQGGRYAAPGGGTHVAAREVVLLKFGEQPGDGPQRFGRLGRRTPLVVANYNIHGHSVGGGHIVVKNN
ncbi:hypothetical protein GCM10010840_30810 [Deinococcus aerolatus]|uniref:Uncharacterized protein n=1 Tax=Deinococcus aerolatus TaxID=522487 RepID=A0ABQ2GEY0_9DEIO|nr:hypothetical protein GCM10010840_30810 [Deinococcus aerolatus]